MVLTHSIKIRLLALFVVAFICLNAGGAACVAYCRTADALPVASEHCPLKKIDDHCDGQAESMPARESIGTDKIECCPMTVSFFGAPVEKPSFRFGSAATALVVGTTRPQTLVFAKRTVSQVVNYRGPPLLDSRSNRIKHRLLLI